MDFNKNRAKFELKDNWLTDPEIIKRINTVSSIVYDPFGSENSFVGALKTNIYNLDKPETNGFEQYWPEFCEKSGVIFCNPPFSKKGDFAKTWKHVASLLSDFGGETPLTMFSMLPVNAEQPYYHKMLSITGSYQIIYKGRLCYWQFNEQTGEMRRGEQPSFASTSFVYGFEAVKICQQFKDIATIIHLR